MDTKWKKWSKWNKVTGFVCFFAGITLLLGGLLSIFSGFLNWRYTPARVSELMNGDYQNTQKFRECISDRLADALGMAVGEPFESYSWYGYGYDYDYGYEYDYEWMLEQEAIQGMTSDEISEAWESDYAQTGYADSWYGGWRREMTPEQKKEMADRMHDRMEPDKNVLYTISYEGELLYSNTEGRQLDTGADLPEGYNFLLHFDGGKVRIVKDGREVDVYGDGYYREDSGWNVPGYENFTSDEKMQKAEIYIAAAQEPQRYLYAKAGQPGYVRAEDNLYWIQRCLKEEKTLFIRDIIYLAAGMLLLTIAHFQRDGRKQAQEAIAGFLGRVWLEAKVLLGLAIFLLTVVWNANFSIYQDIMESITIVSGEVSYDYGGGAYLAAEMLQEGIRLIFAAPAVLIVLFLLVYFAVLDIRKNKCVWKMSLTAKLLGFFSAKEIKLPFAKKMIYRCIPGSVCMILSVVLLAAAVLGKNSFLLALSLLAAVLAIGMQCIYAAGIRRLAADMDLLAQRITAIHGGWYESGGEMAASPDLAEAFAGLEDIRQGMARAIDEQVKSQRMKVELITNVSHDIKTPLTSIISYVEFLKQEEGLPEHVKDYIRILDEKSQRLKNMIQDVFAVSKAAAGQLAVNMEQLDFGKLLRQTMADMEEQIESSNVTVKADIPEEPVMIEADGQKLYRVFQNLIQNALQYSLEGSRVYITMKTDGSLAAASVKNTSRTEIDQDKDFTERFVRGDESRTDAGSGLGLSIALSFTEACGGGFKLETIADLFLVTVSFKTI